MYPLLKICLSCNIPSNHAWMAPRATKHKMVVIVAWHNNIEWPRSMSKLFPLVVQVLQDNAFERLEDELDDCQWQLALLMTIWVIKNLRWDHQDVPCQVNTLGIVLPDHMISVFLYLTDNSGLCQWSVDAKSQTYKIVKLNWLELQMELLLNRSKWSPSPKWSQGFITSKVKYMP